MTEHQKNNPKNNSKPKLQMGFIVSFMVGILIGSFLFLGELANTFNSGGGNRTSSFDYVLYFVVFLMVFIPVGYFLYSVFGLKKIGYASATLAAMAIIYVAYHVMVVIPKENKAYNAKIEAYKRKLQIYKRDYSSNRMGKYRVEFFHIKNNRILLIIGQQLKHYTIQAKPVGKINNGVLELYTGDEYTKSKNKKKWLHFRDKRGKTIFDNYKTVWKIQDLKGYHLESFNYNP